MINKMSLPLNSNNVNFKSTFRKDAELERLMGLASNKDLVDFLQTLEMLKNDGKEDEYFIEKGTDKIFYLGYDCFDKTRNYIVRPEIRLFKFDGSDFITKKIVDIVVGSEILNTSWESVISEITRNLRYKCEMLHTPEFRKQIASKIEKLLI